MIRDILFDLGNVLTPLNWDRALLRLLPHLPPKMARLLTMDRQAFVELFREPSIALETGKIDFNGFYNIMSGVLAIEIDEADFRYIWCDIFAEDPEMVVLGELLSRNYGTWLLSNTCEVHYNWIMEKFPRVVFFKDAALSFELGVMKPSRRYYEEAIRKFGIDPSASVFIDDLKQNVDGAIRVGINSIQFQGPKLLIQELRKLGVEVPDSKE